MKKWFSIISPCVLAAMLSLAVMIYGYLNKYEAEGWSFLLTIIFAPIFFVMILIDIITKIFFRKKPFHIWGVQLPALIIVYWVWVRYYFLGS